MEVKAATKVQRSHKLTDAASCWFSPRLIWTTVDVLETFQFEPGVALELLILTKVIILLCFLVAEKLEKRRKVRNYCSIKQSKEDCSGSTELWGVFVYPEEAVGRTFRPSAALHTRGQLVNPAHCEVVIVVTGLLSGHQNMSQERSPKLNTTKEDKVNPEVVFSVVAADGKQYLYIHICTLFCTHILYVYKTVMMLMHIRNWTLASTFERWRCNMGPHLCWDPGRVGLLSVGRGYRTALIDASS